MSVDPTRIPIDVDPREQRMSGTAFHGDPPFDERTGTGGTPFDVPYVSQIDENLWTGGCANGLVLPRNIVHVVSLYAWERYDVNHNLRSVLSVVMYDSLAQTTDQVGAIAAWVNACRADGPTLVHCQAGLNRSGLVAATALILDGREPADAIALLREKRSPAVLCNSAFEQWLLEAA